MTGGSIDHKGETRHRSRGRVPFDLTVEPWMPVTDLSGRRSVRSLIDVACNADRLRRLDIGDPLERAAAHRLLFAIAQAAGDEPMDEYLWRWRERFDLTDPDKPFMQTPGLTPTNPGRTPSLEPLCPAMKRHLWDPIPEHGPIGPARATLMMLACMAYDVSGIHTGMRGDPRVTAGKSHARGPAEAGWYTIAVIHGDTLADTIRLNTVTTDPGDRPVWELDPMTPDASGTRMTGPTAALTWPSRRIRLLFDDEACVGANVSHGDDHVKGRGHEPSAFWNTKQNRSVGIASVDPTKDNHRYYLPLWGKWKDLMDPGNTPETFDGMFDHADRRDIELVDVGYGSNQAVVVSVRAERLALCSKAMRRHDDTVAFAEAAYRKAAPAWYRTHDPHAFDTQDRIMRRWLASGEEPEA